MREQNLPDFNKTNERVRTERIIGLLIRVSWAVYLVVLLSNIYYKDWKVIIAVLISAAFLLIPFFLLKSGRQIAGAFFLVLLLLLNITALATVGQGIHDVSIIAYPIILIFASLTLDRRGFLTCVGMSFLSIAWLVFGELFAIDFLVIAALLTAAALAVDLLAANMRRSLALAEQEIERRVKSEELLRFQSSHDMMTGVYNRNFFEEELARLEVSRLYPISVIVADVDGLKSVNDNIGHAAGDQLLCEAASILRSVFRAEDIFARIGGDEFAALLPETNDATAQKILARIAECLEERNGLMKTKVSISLGSATAWEKNLAGTFTLADSRMYENKHSKKTQE
jgi:diguanylate cyclase (GGDEF)-like protein